MKRYTLALAFVLAGFGCKEQFVFPQSGDPQIEVRIPDISKTLQQDYADGTIEIRNVGDGPLGVDSLAIREEGVDAIEEVFAVGSAWNRFHVLKAGESLDLTVRYDPENMAPDRAWVLMQHNDGSKDQFTWQIPLPTVRPDVEVLGTDSHGNLTFSEVDVGDSRSRTIVIKNEGNYPLDLENLKLGPNPNFSYEIIKGPEESVAAGEREP